MSELNNCDAESVFCADSSRASCGTVGASARSEFAGFSLSRAKGSVFPESVWIKGAEYAVNADFRNVLRIFRLIEDMRISERHKRELVCRFFYAERGGRLGLLVNDGVLGFCGFAAGGFANGGGRGEGLMADLADLADSGGEKRFDFEQDACEIYQSFLFDYSIDLVDVGFMHFYRFCVLLRGLSPESPFMRKLAVRLMDTGGLTGAALSRALEAKASVALIEKLSPSEIREAKEFEEIWGRR